MARTVAELTREFHQLRPPTELKFLHELWGALRGDNQVDECDLASLAIRLRVEAITIKALGLAEASRMILELCREVEGLYTNVRDEDYLRYLHKLKSACDELEA